MTRGESLEQALLRHGFEVDGETFTRMNGTAEELVRGVGPSDVRPVSLLDDVELEIRAYGEPIIMPMTGFELVVHLNEHGGNSPTLPDDGGRPLTGLLPSSVSREDALAAAAAIGFQIRQTLRTIANDDEIDFTASVLADQARRAARYAEIALGDAFLSPSGRHLGPRVES